MNGTLKNIERTTVEDQSMIEFLDRARIELR